MRIPARAPLALAVALAATGPGAVATAEANAHATPAARMAAAATNFLDGLTPEKRGQSELAFDTRT